MHRSSSLKKQNHLAIIWQIILILSILTSLASLPTTPARAESIDAAPNAPVLVQPADNATGVSTPPSLQVTASDPDAGGTLSVSFYGRSAGGSSGADFMIVAIPDAQNYATSYPSTYTNHLKWIADNKSANNIAFATSVGDLVNTPSSSTEYTNADTAFDTLDAGNVSYSVGPGNHDMMSGTLWANYFPTSRFSGKSYYGGSYDNYNNYYLFSASGMDFILINLQYSPTTAILDWADARLKQYPSRRAIVEEHDILNTNNSFVNSAAYDALRDNNNLFLMLCGHMHASNDGAAYVAGTGTGTAAQTIHIVMQDYQDFANSGYLRLYRFSPANNMIYMTTYSPTSGNSITTDPDQKNLAYTMGGGSSYTLINTASGVANGANASVSWSGLANNTEYEWYAVVSDGTSSTTGPTWSFTTGTTSNTAPVANAQSVTTNEDTVKAITLTATDANSDPLTYSIVSSPGHGSLSGTAPNVTYTPASNYNGSDTFTFKANDGKVDSSPATVSITVAGVNDAPTASAQSVSTSQDTAKVITLSGSDVEGSALTYAIGASPTHGALSGSAPNVTYTPTSGYTGSDSFTFTVNDGSLTSSPATVSITVSGTNSAPVANAQSVTTNEDTAKAITLTATDANGDPLTYSIVSSPAHGSLSGTAPNVTFTPTANYNGTDSFTFKANDGKVDSLVAAVSITVASVNDAPTANAQSTSTNEDTAKVITLSGSDVEGSALTYTVVTNPAHGALSGTAPNLTYIPTANFSGSDTFTFRVSDGSLNSSNATVTITISPVNDAPTATAQSVTTNQNTAKAITLSGSDVEGSALTYAIASNPSHGALSGSGANRTYTPTTGYSGSDSFTFTVNDGSLTSSAATVSITVAAVNAAPVASAQTVTTNEDTAKAITLSATDADNDALTYSVVSSPAHGSLSGTAPNLTYTPASNYNGSDSFTFKANDGKVDSSPATVSITVASVNDAPTATAQSTSTNEDVARAITLSGSDVDGNPLTYSIVSNPANGALSGTPPSVTYTPNANFNGSDSFTFKVNDGTVDSVAATVSITVAPVNDAPTATAQSVTTNEDTARAITLSGSDVEGSALSYTIASSPTHGALSGSAPNVTYTPSANYNGSDSFTFTVSDGSLASLAATVSITVAAVNDAPVASAQSVSLNQDTARAIVLSATDADNNPLTYAIASNPSHGALSGSAPNVTYTPTANFSGSDAFSFTVSDGSLTSSAATVSITVTAVNHAPVANAQSVTTNEDTAKAIVLSATDSDSDPLTYAIVASPAHGALSGTAPNLTYIPTANFSGSDAFTFKANDGKVDSAGATVSITVAPVNDAPVLAAIGAKSGNELALLSFTATATDDGSSLGYSLVGAPSGASIHPTTGVFTWTPSETQGPGGFTFDVCVSDGSYSDCETITVTVLEVNRDPVLNPIGSMSGATGKLLTFTATGTDEDIPANTLSYLLVNAPAGASIDPFSGVFTWTPTAAGTYTFDVSVSDGKAADAETITVTVVETPPTYYLFMPLNFKNP
jgi:large repetitive protein